MYHIQSEVFLKKLRDNMYDKCLKNIRTDVTLVTSDQFIHCHRIVLESGTNWFQALFQELEPLSGKLVVYLRGVESALLHHLLRYMYTGEMEIEVSKIWYISQ